VEKEKERGREWGSRWEARVEKEKERGREWGSRW